MPAPPPGHRVGARVSGWGHLTRVYLAGKLHRAEQFRRVRDDWHARGAAVVVSSWLDMPIDAAPDIQTTQHYAHRETTAKQAAVDAAASRWRHNDDQPPKQRTETKGKMRG